MKLSATRRFSVFLFLWYKQASRPFNLGFNILMHLFSAKFQRILHTDGREVIHLTHVFEGKIWNPKSKARYLSVAHEGVDRLGT